MKSCCEHHRFNCNQGRTCPLRKVRSLNPGRLKVALCLACFFLTYGVVGRMDYEDQVAQEAPRPAPTMMASQGAAL